MSSQVIGFFDNRPEAERVKEDLISAGFDQGDVDVFAQPGTPSGQPQAEEPGFWEKMKEFFGLASEEDRRMYAEASRHGAVAVSVDADNDAEVARATDILRQRHAINLDERMKQWGTQGGTTTAQTAATTQPVQPIQGQNIQGQQVLPVTEEELRVGKREVQTGGIRVYSRVTEKPVEENVQLRKEHVEVERRPVDRPIQPGDQAFQERTIEVKETSEEPVVSKQARVVEEVAVRKDVEQKTQTIHDTVRRSDVEVEKLGPDDIRLSDSFAQDLSHDQRFTGRDWNTIETDARGDFEKRYPGRKWDQFKDAIRRGYDKSRPST